jgi:FixJ family two-component response regulator
MAHGDVSAFARSMVVMIVEDNTVLRRSLERVVARAYTPLACSSFDQAKEALATLATPLGALIVDVNLGGRGDGIDIAMHAHERFGRHIPTLVLTGTILPEVTERAQALRCEFLIKPQSMDAVRLFLERARIHCAWDLPDVLELDHAVARFATEQRLTARQHKLLYTMMRAAERGERSDLNPNTRKAAIRRITARTGHAGFEEIRIAIKQLARGASTSSS